MTILTHQFEVAFFRYLFWIHGHWNNMVDAECINGKSLTTAGTYATRFLVYPFFCPVQLPSFVASQFIQFVSPLHPIFANIDVDTKYFDHHN